MNRGFIITEIQDKFLLHKISTWSDIRPLRFENSEDENTFEELKHKNCTDGDIGIFDNFDDALSTAKKLIGWQEESPVHVQDSSTSWKMELSYHHKLLGNKFADLGELGPTSYDTACDEAKKRADAYILHGDLEKSINGFETRVRPCRKRS